MPIYEYACSACGHEFEEWQKMSDPPVRTCPKCKKKKVERLISQTAFQLKGGGWYADLYSSSKPGKGGGSSDSSEGAGDKGSGDKSAGGEGSKDSGPKDAASAKSDSKASAKSDSKSDSRSGKSAESSGKKESKTASKKSETRAA